MVVAVVENCTMAYSELFLLVSRMAMMITEMYTMLGGEQFLAANAESLYKVLHLTVAKVRPRGAKYVGLVLEALLREFPSDGGLLLLRSGILEKMLRSCALNHVNDRQCESDKVISVYLNSLTRVLFTSPKILDSLLPLVDAGGISNFSFGYKDLVSICTFEHELCRRQRLTHVSLCPSYNST